MATGSNGKSEVAAESVVVRFEWNDGACKGTITEDRLGHRSKIVRIDGHNGPGMRAGSFKDLLPRDGAEWLCQVVSETKPEDATRGVLFVRLCVPVRPEEPNDCKSIPDTERYCPCCHISLPRATYTQHLRMECKDGRLMCWCPNCRRTIVVDPESAAVEVRCTETYRWSRARGRSVLERTKSVVTRTPVLCAMLAA